MTLSVKQFLTSKDITMIWHHPYSPDLAPCDFFSFLQFNLFERDSILPQKNGFHSKTEKSPKGTSDNFVPELLPAHRMLKRVNAEVNYFEGDNVTGN
ncbi:hypothetical protein TNCV_3379131 [Trichonephila clavipes]|nr:hypothetical protein TNCV_3379131 [Trichonephila clavipes]